jgi:hypothetical protein
MIVGRSAIMFTTAAAMILALPVLGAGCGSTPAEYDVAAAYTPGALAEELIVRYRALNSDAKTSKRGTTNKISAAAIAARNKVDRKSITRTTKKRGPTTIDDVIEDIGYKISAAAIAARNKADRKAVTRTTKKRGPTTIDDVVEDIGYKMVLIRGTPRAETAKQMIETISSDNSLAPSDKKVLSEMVGRLAD